MESRYRELYRIPPMLYCKGSPVVIEIGALQNDTTLHKVLVQLKICNISNFIITSCKVQIFAFENNGDALTGVDSFSFLDLSVDKHQTFGSKTPIYLPDNITRSFKAMVTEVVFADKTIWRSNDAEWFPITNRGMIRKYFSNAELEREYSLEAGKNRPYTPEIRGNLFLCGCGRINTPASSRCSCGLAYEDFIPMLDRTLIRERANHRIENERREKIRHAELVAAQRAEEERRILEEAAVARENSVKKKKVIKRGIIAGVSILFLIAIIAVVVFFVLPEKKNHLDREDVKLLQWKGHTYAVFDNADENLEKTYDAWENFCETICKDATGHLVVITSAEENEVVYNFLENCGYGVAYIGLSDRDQEGEYKWVDGELFNYSNWAQYPVKEPNNGAENNKGRAENFVQFYKETCDGTWNDVSFDVNSEAFICEWDCEVYNGNEVTVTENN